MDDEPKKRGRPRAQPVAEAGTFACRVLRDYWPEEDVRIRAGTVVHVDAVAAMDGIESGILSRVK
jgi:hypothetical protein